jgi:uncharacterized protein (DUF983 family)
MARKCTEYHYFKHTYWDAMAQYNWTRCPHCGKLCKPSRFKAATVLMPIEFDYDFDAYRAKYTDKAPIEFVIFVVCIFFRNSMNDAIGWFAAWLLFVLLLFLPQYIYVRFFMPYETLSEDETRKFRDLQEH